jgi:iron complex transport system substrate-binding protein
MKKPQVIQVMILAGLGLAAGILATSKPRPATPTSIPAAVQPQKAGTRILHYLGKEYPLPLKTGKIVVTGSLEALEDLLELRVKPVGVMTVGGTFPALFAAITQGAIPVGEKMQPSLEAILQIQPDVIISSDKFPPATAEQLQKIAPTIPISHFPADAAANLCFLGELTGKAEQAEAILAKYRREVAAARARLPESLKTKKVVAARLRVGNILVYSRQLFFNDILYQELGFLAPGDIQAVRGSEVMALEKFSEMDPDYIFLQYAASENPANSKVLEELEQNPVWRSMKAVKNNRVFVNAVDPMVQGVAASGKMRFLHAALEKLSGLRK